MQITIRAAEGRRVRHPETKQVLDNRALTVEKSGYWTRRLLAGDVVLVDDAASTKKAPDATKATPKAKTETGEK